jgi:diacylglycerol O-acyltransferase
MPKEPLSSIDTAWLRLEDRSHPMMITAAITFGAPLDAERLKATFRDRLLCYRRFRQRVIQPRQASGRPYWEEDPDFDLGFHLQPLSLRPPGDEAALRDAISELMSTQLDFSRPLWQFHLIEEYGDGWALVGRVHHCLADGPSLLHSLASLTRDDGPDPWPSAEREEVRASQDRSVAATALGATVSATGALAQQGARILRHPLYLLSLARSGTGSASALSRMLFRLPDPQTAFRGKLGPAKRAAWSAPVSLADVKNTGRVVGGTVNDVMLAATSGALRQYLQSRGDPVEGLTIRAGLSVNLRSPETEPEPGNQAGALLVPLHLGIADPLERLFTVKRTMDDLKSSPEATVVYGLLNALGMAPTETQDALVESYCTRDTAMMANVPGPGETIHLAGAPLETLLFWVPAFGAVGLNLNFISYAGWIRLGIATDKGLVPDPDRIVAEFEAEFEALQAAAGELEAKGANDAAGEGSIEAMSAMLDDAVRALDALLERRESSKCKRSAD